VSGTFQCCRILKVLYGVTLSNPSIYGTDGFNLLRAAERDIDSDSICPSVSLVPPSETLRHCAKMAKGIVDIFPADC